MNGFKIVVRSTSLNVGNIHVGCGLISKLKIIINLSVLQSIEIHIWSLATESSNFVIDVYISQILQIHVWVDFWQIDTWSLHISLSQFLQIDISALSVVESEINVRRLGVINAYLDIAIVISLCVYLPTLELICWDIYISLCFKVVFNVSEILLNVLEILLIYRVRSLSIQLLRIGISFSVDEAEGCAHADEWYKDIFQHKNNL